MNNLSAFRHFINILHQNETFTSDHTLFRSLSLPISLMELFKLYLKLISREINFSLVRAIPCLLLVSAPEQGTNDQLNYG